MMNFVRGFTVWNIGKREAGELRQMTYCATVPRDRACNRWLASSTRVGEKNMQRLWYLAFSVTLLTRTAATQTSPDVKWPVDSGTKVRVLVVGLGSGVRRGTLVSTTTDSITVEPVSAGSFSVGLDQIKSLHVLSGSHTNKAKYTMVGLLVGALTGAVLGAATYSPSKCDPSVTFCVDVFDRGASAAMGAVLLGGVGGLVGLMAGASPKETWTSVSLPSR